MRGERWAALLARHRELIRAAISSVDGHEEKTEGDAFVAVFRRPFDAINAAVDAQRRLAAEPWPDGTTVRGKRRSFRERMKKVAALAVAALERDTRISEKKP